VADALRLCITLGGISGSTELRDWASRELKGYQQEAPVPDYRRVPASIHIDGLRGNAFTGTLAIRGQRISPDELPDFVRKDVEEELHLSNPIAEIERLSRGDEAVKFSLPMGADIARVMNYENGDPSSVVQEVYWSVSRSALSTVVDQVRTNLVELVAEIRAGLAGDTTVPSSELADRAVEIAIHGSGNRVILSTVRGAGDASASIDTPSPDSDFGLGKSLAILAAISTIVATFFGLVRLL
jgi:hypothetical protein